jgi:hypothetical protein
MCATAADEVWMAGIRITEGTQHKVLFLAAAVDRQNAAQCSMEVETHK